MDISYQTLIEATPDAVADALLSRELAAKRMEALSVSDWEHSREGARAVTDARLGADRLPEAARRFIRGALHLTVTARTQGDAVVYDVDTHGLPGEVTLREDLAPAGEGVTKVNVSGELHVKIPLIGGKLEQQAGKYVNSILRRDARLITDVVNEKA